VTYKNIYVLLIIKLSRVKVINAYSMAVSQLLQRLIISNYKQLKYCYHRLLLHAYYKDKHN